MSTFSEALQAARAVMDRGGFRDAFNRIIDIPVSRPDELFDKIAILVDSGIALRDTTMLDYGLYLMEHHAQDILAVPSLAPFLHFNLANLRSNLLVIREAEGGRRCWYDRKLTAPARGSYAKAMEETQDDKLRAKILTAHGRLLMGLGRDIEAFDNFHRALQMDPHDEEARYGRTECLLGLAGMAPALENDLLQESALELSVLLDGEEGPGSNLSGENLKSRIFSRLNGGVLEDGFSYPQNTVVTGSEREHTMVMFSLKNQLYLTPCASCRKCDRSVGDAAALGAHHAIVGPGAARRYRRLAILTGRLTERYRSLRTALIDHHRGADTPDGGDHQPHFPEVAGWQSVPPATSMLITALAGSGAIMEGMASCVAVELNRDTTGPVRITHILGSPSAPGTALTEVRNPALHAFWDLWADGVDGRVEGATLVELFGSSLLPKDVAELILDGNRFTDVAMGLTVWIKNLISYLILMADRDARGEIDDPPLWPLQPFVIPKR